MELLQHSMSNFKENHITDNIINSDKNFLLYFAKKYPYPPHPSI